MKTWRKYEEYLLTGEWHVHTNYTDGQKSVFEICERARELGIPLLAFTEHVRGELTYDFNEFLSDIDRAREEFPELIILSGIEAKVLPDGSLDVEDEIIKQVDYPIFAFHSFPRNKELYMECLKKAIKNRYVNAWAHPGLFLKRNGLNLKTNKLTEIFNMMKKYNVLLEINRRYSLPEKEWINMASKIGLKTVRGSDIHTIRELSGGGL